ncbi:hypothetical protein KAW50_08705, partial [candidate division WOR-3 bacterium]|nr:hypothetical protein [candidate division WOR-3 bacterium]
MTLKLNPELSHEVWKLAYPLILASISQSLLSIVDTAFVGRISPSALAAAGMGGIVLLTITVFLGALYWGTQALTARRYGEGKFSQCGKILDNSLVIAIVLGGIITFLAPVIARFLSPFFESDPKMGKLLYEYMEYRLY